MSIKQKSPAFRQGFTFRLVDLRVEISNQFHEDLLRIVEVHSSKTLVADFDFECLMIPELGLPS
jgi:hypothetical protein